MKEKIDGTTLGRKGGAVCVYARKSLLIISDNLGKLLNALDKNVTLILPTEQNGQLKYFVNI